MLFEILRSVSGIGPKTAILIIGNIGIYNFQIALMNSDISTLSKVPGIGKKTAERLIIDLRDKIKNISIKLYLF